MLMLRASEGSRKAGWHCAAAEKGVSEPEFKDVILAPQQYCGEVSYGDALVNLYWKTYSYYAPGSDIGRELLELL